MKRERKQKTGNEEFYRQKVREGYSLSYAKKRWPEMEPKFETIGQWNKPYAK